MLELHIDYRERALIDALRQHHPETSLVVKNLPIGDLAIRNDDGVCLVVERKTVRDLMASITDGRFREQKRRLEDSGVVHVVYIIEGSLWHDDGGKHSISYGAVVNLIFKHNFKVIMSCDPNDTARYVVLLLKKLAAGELERAPVADQSFVRRGDKVLANVFKHQLCVVPGVSPAIASKIVETYHTMSSLVHQYATLSSEKEREVLLAGLQVHPTRKLGGALSRKIYMCLCRSDHVSEVPASNESSGPG